MRISTHGNGNGNGNKFSKLNIHEVQTLIDLICNIQTLNHKELVIPVLCDFEKLLRIKGCVLGIRNYSSNKNLLMIKTLGTLRDNTLYSSWYCSTKKLRQYKLPTFKVQGTEQNLKSFLYLNCSKGKIDKRQQEILSITLPYLHEATCKVHTISKMTSDLGLTKREIEIMRWITAGKDNWSISRILGISERTIKFHNCNIYKKLGVNTRLEAASFYHRYMSHTNLLNNRTAQMIKVRGLV